MQRITPVDIQHRTFKKALQGYDRAEVDQFLDEIIETLEDDAQHRAALEAEIADLKERISHFKAMEESLQNTLVLAQRTADEVKASAHKEADLIKEQARIAAEREISTFTEAAADARREHQRANEAAGKGAQRTAELAHDAHVAARKDSGASQRRAGAICSRGGGAGCGRGAVRHERHQPHHRLLAPSRSCPVTASGPK